MSTTTMETSEALTALAQRMVARACAQNVVDRELLDDAEKLHGLAQDVSDTPANPQANALLERVRLNVGPSRVFTASFGLPDGYLLVTDAEVPGLTFCSNLCARVTMPAASVYLACIASAN